MHLNLSTSSPVPMPLGLVHAVQVVHAAALFATAAFCYHCQHTQRYGEHYYIPELLPVCSFHNILL